MKKADKLEKLAQYGYTGMAYLQKVQTKKKADKAIAKTREFFESLGVSTHLKDYGLVKKQLIKL